MLVFLNEEMVDYTGDTFRSHHDGHIGSSYEKIIYVRNNDAARYYVNIELIPELVGDYNSDNRFSLTGWGVKLMYGSRRPTEAEWSLVKSGDGIQLPNIGSYEAADTTTNHPVWVRIYCPGNEPAQIKRNMRLKISYDERMVGVE